MTRRYTFRATVDQEQHADGQARMRERAAERPIVGGAQALERAIVRQVATPGRELVPAACAE